MIIFVIICYYLLLFTIICYYFSLFVNICYYLLKFVNFSSAMLCFSWKGYKNTHILRVCWFARYIHLKTNFSVADWTIIVTMILQRKLRARYCTARFVLLLLVLLSKIKPVFSFLCQIFPLCVRYQNKKYL